MQTRMKKNFNRSGNALMVAVLVVGGVLVLGATLFALRTPTQTDTKAVTPGGAGKVSVSPATKTVYPPSTFPVTVKFNTGATPQAISSLTFRLVFNCGGNCQTSPALDVVDGSGAPANSVTIEPAISGDLKWAIPVKSVTRSATQITVDVSAIYNSISGFSSSSDVNLVSFNLKASSPVVANLAFDSARSVMLLKSNGSTDILGTATGATYTVQNDTAAPSAVSNLNSPSVTTDSVTLSWSTPADSGPAGVPASYDIRYSTSPITSANFGSATAVTGEPVPAVAGQTQSYTVSGLGPNATYYFAMRSTDSAGNVSAISNVVSVTTANPNSTLSFGYRLDGISTGTLSPLAPLENVVVTIKNGTNVVGTYPGVAVTAGANGVFKPTTAIPLGSLPIGANGTTYSVFVKEPRHLQKNLGTMVFNYGNNTTTAFDGIELDSGDFNNDNVIEGGDIAAVLSKYTVLETPTTGATANYDVDKNGKIDIYDISIPLANYTALTVNGD